MAEDDRLQPFVENALARGVSRQQLESALAAAGWRAEEIREALASFVDAGLPLPVPRRRPYLSAREAFLYLVLFTALYLWCWYLGSLCFDLVDRAFPDPGMGRRAANDTSSIRWAVAWLVVSFPVFLLLSRSLERAARAEPAKRGSRVRKWLTYLTLYVSATAVLADFATLVYNALDGELTTRFLLKVATVVLIAGGAFWYYLVDLRRDEREIPATAARRNSLWAVVASVAVVAGLAAALWTLGSPADRRLLRLDRERVQNLMALRVDLDTHLGRTDALPSTLRELARQPWADPEQTDPVTFEPFGYEVLAPRRYRLCATFSRPSPAPPPDEKPDFWHHPQGRHCYEIEVPEKTAEAPWR